VDPRYPDIERVYIWRDIERCRDMKIYIERDIERHADI